MRFRAIAVVSRANENNGKCNRKMFISFVDGLQAENDDEELNTDR